MVTINDKISGESTIFREQIDSRVRRNNVYYDNQRNNNDKKLLDLGHLYVLLGKASGIRADIAIAQAAYETGWFKADKFTKNNNLAGIGGPGNFYSYPSLRTGIEAHYSLMQRYLDPNTLQYQRQIERVGEVGTLKSIASVWDPSKSPEEYSGTVADIANGFLSEPQPDPPAITGSYGEIQIQSVLNMNLMTGQPDGYFRPEWPVTRAEIASLTASVFDYQNQQAPFRPVDVPASHWAANSVQRVLAQGWMTVDANGQFHPNLPVSRAELAVILSRLKLPILNLRTLRTWLDVGKEWFSEAIHNIYTKGLMAGYSDNRFEPLWPVERAEVAVTINNLVPKLHGLSEGKLEDAVWVTEIGQWMPATWATITYGTQGTYRAPIMTMGTQSLSKPPGAPPWALLLGGAAAAGLITYLVEYKRKR